MKIAIMGFGVVGSGAYEVAKLAGGIEVKRILDLKVRPGYEDVAEKFTTELSDITGDTEIELVIEAMGGIDTPREFVLACLNAGKHVVTPNKNLISACYKELTECAAANDVSLRYTPSAGGAIPWLFNLARTKRCDNITEIRGIVNGTANFILDAMHDKGADFAEVLKEAQELGYAERNPSADIEGTDTLRKTVISSNIAYDAAITEDQVPCYGIDTIKACDIDWFKANGYTCKLMMKSKRNDDRLAVCVEPTLFAQDKLEANVKANYNLITLVADNAGPLAFYGQGAGSRPTGQSVISDVVDIRDAVEMKAPSKAGDITVDNSELRKYYIRHDRMCEHIEPMIESFEEKDGIFFCISKPIAVSEMHAMAQHRKEKGREMFFASIE
ncbi:MAG: homoserine dehydrogenase [Firmicutes bacterium]|nr:homoserine dehydrogenase [Bacillota bacterium]